MRVSLCIVFLVLTVGITYVTWHRLLAWIFYYFEWSGEILLPLCSYTLHSLVFKYNCPRYFFYIHWHQGSPLLSSTPFPFFYPHLLNPFYAPSITLGVAVPWMKRKNINKFSILCLSPVRDRDACEHTLERRGNTNVPKHVVTYWNTISIN